MKKEKKRKRLFWTYIFIFLIIINAFITVRYVNKMRRVNLAFQILEEIDKSALDIYKKAGKKFGFFDYRVANLEGFFQKHSSPLYDHAKLIVKTADKYGLDYRLVPAIAMQESTLCKNIPKTSYNCWGWGIYGNQVVRFQSYEEAIETVSKGLKEHYIDKGFVTTYQIMQKYTPSSNGSWANAVNWVIRHIEL
jgi:hypothetical protein